MWNKGKSRALLNHLGARPTNGDSPAGAERGPRRAVKVVLATSVMLTFISFWRAAAIVLCDLGSSAFYVGGIAEQAIGRAAPWFILGVMCFSYAVRAIYIESCAMFTRGGVYRVVKEAMGRTLAKLSVSALMFDYILTGPISGVSAGQYIVGLAAQSLTYFGCVWQPSKEAVNLLAAAIASLITICFWWRNTKGIHESSHDALRIMSVTTAMVVIMVLWSGLTILTNPDKRRLPPLPVPQNLVLSKDAVGWVPQLAPQALQSQPAAMTQRPGGNSGKPRQESHYFIPPNTGTLLGLLGLFIAFGHSILAMSGEESLAQVNREIEYPKHKNLVRAGLVIFVYSLLFTSLVSFFAYSIIPDAERSRYFDNLISGIAMNLAGPTPLKLLFQAFVVIVGFLMLAGAVNTAIIGSTGVLNRVSEDGVLAAWFRAPHKRFGTSYRIINLIVTLQLATILGSRGNIYTLGEAYAFGVVWSFALKGFAVLTLRFKDRTPREWKVPLNLRLAGRELPVGLCVITTLLLLTAGTNLITKQVATVSGLIFTGGLFTLFTLSEGTARTRLQTTGLDEFQLVPKEKVDLEGLQLRPAPILVAVRDPKILRHLEIALAETDTTATDVVAVTARIIQGTAAGYRDIFQEDLFTDYEQLLFTRVVALAERAGKPVKLLAVPSNNAFSAIVNTAVQLRAARVYAGTSEAMTGEAQARLLGDVWERNHVPDKPQFGLILVPRQGPPGRFEIGAHAPDLSPEDIDLIHGLWLKLSGALPRVELHHRDVVTLALQRLQQQLEGSEKARVLATVRRMWGDDLTKPPSDARQLHTKPAPDRDTFVPPRLGRQSLEALIPHPCPPLHPNKVNTRRRYQTLSLLGTFLSFCIVSILIIGLIRNPTGTGGDLLMALLAGLALARLGIAVAKMRMRRRRDRSKTPGVLTGKETAGHRDNPALTLRAR